MPLSFKVGSMLIPSTRIGIRTNREIRISDAAQITMRTTVNLGLRPTSTRLTQPSLIIAIPY
jgi:hypothetical protein